jgi:hypothetical protein
MSVDVQGPHARAQLVRDGPDLLREQVARVFGGRERVMDAGERHLVDPEVTQ